MTSFDEQLLDKIVITINFPPSRRQRLIQTDIQIDDDSARQAIERFLSMQRFDDLNLIATGIVNRRTVGMDMQEMEYPHPQNPTTDDIIIGDGLEFSVSLTESTFNRLMLHVFDSLIEKINASDVTFAPDDKWQSFIESVEVLRDRVQ